MSETENLALWNSVQKTDPKYTSRARVGGHEFTSANAQWQIMRATELWGPCGFGWEVTHSGQLVSASDEEKVWLEEVTVKYPGPNGEWSKVTHYGVAKFCYKTSGDSGYFKVDEQAPKKALTNGISKALSLVGFSADLWLKYYDDPDYVASVGLSFDAERASRSDENILKRLKKILQQTVTAEDPEGINEQENLLCLFWSSGKHTAEEAFADASIAQEINNAQSKMCAEIPVALQMKAAIEFSEGGEA